jgi:hypothetical protein
MPSKRAQLAPAERTNAEFQADVASNTALLPRVEIQWTERELESLAKLGSRPKADAPTAALIRAMRD